MKTSANTIAVIICAWTSQRWNQLQAAIESVADQSHPADQIIVVVDYNEQLLQAVRDRFPTVLAIPNAGKRGLSGARNSGIARCGSSIVAFLDDDAIADRRWIAALLAVFADGRVLGAGGWIQPAWETSRPGWFPEEFDWVIGCSYRGLRWDAGPIRNVIGANMAFRRDVFSAIGGFREGIGRVETLPLGCEETELSIRVRQSDPAAQILHVPDAIVHHLVPATRLTVSYFLRRCWSEGISKAAIVRFVGASDGLAAERRQVIRVLPLAVVQALIGSVQNRDPWLLGRALAILAGFVATTSGYLTSQVRATLRRRPARPPRPPLAPTLKPGLPVRTAER